MTRGDPNGLRRIGNGIDQGIADHRIIGFAKRRSIHSKIVRSEIGRCVFEQDPTAIVIPAIGLSMIPDNTRNSITLPNSTSYRLVGQWLRLPCLFWPTTELVGRAPFLFPGGFI